MNSEIIFRISIAVIGLLLATVRMYYTAKAIRSGQPFWRPAGDIRQLVFGTLGMLIIIPVVIYIFAPDWLAWAALALPASLRWTGVALGLISLVLLVWVHHTLGQNFSLPGVIKERQELVMRGPYRWVRHPMYSVLFLISLAYFLISANWLIGLGWLGWITGTVASLVRTEEAALMATFGDAYRAYMQRTGRFLPRIRWNEGGA